MAGHGLSPCSTQGQPAPGATHGGQSPGGEASAMEPQNGILGPPALGLDHSPRQKPNDSNKLVEYGQVATDQRLLGRLLRY